MTGANFKKAVAVAGLGLAAWLSTSVDANAFWRHGSSGGSSGGSWGSSGGSSGGSWGSSGGSSGGSWGSSGGSSGGWGRRHHARRAYASSGSWGSSGGYAYAYSSSGGWGSSGGSSGGYGSSGGSSGGFGSSGGSNGGSYGGSYGGTVTEYGDATAVPTETMSPVEQPAPPTSPSDAPAPAPEGEAPAAPAEGSQTSIQVDRDAVLLNVWVPNDAKVFVNGTATNSTGSARQYISRGLKGGANYAYELRAEVERNGETVTETKQIVLTSGQRASVEFNFEGKKSDRVARKPLKTTLLLRVPADAKVFLSGHETTSTGEVREFSTTRLQTGANWSDYVVRVELNRDGQTLTKEANLSLAGGETRELNVDFDTTSVAQR